MGFGGWMMVVGSSGCRLVVSQLAVAWQPGNYFHKPIDSHNGKR